MIPRSLPLARLFLCLLVLGPAVRAAEGPSELTITRISGPITLDGDLSDPAWQGASRVGTWFETNPGDNVEPKVRSVGWLAYDDTYVYAAFEFADPDPSKIRAPYADRDSIGWWPDGA